MVNISIKEKVVSEIKDKIKNSEALFITDYRGLSVNDISELRKKLRSLNSEYKVYKNTLIKRAILEEEYGSSVGDILEGPTAVAFVHGDLIGTAKAMAEFSKQKEKLEIKGGVIGSVAIDKDKIIYLTKLPGKDVLLAKLLGGMKAPINNFVSTLGAIPRNLVYALDAIRKQKEEQK